MKKLAFVLAFTSLVVKDIKAQNLVYDYSFENITTCPIYYLNLPQYISTNWIGASTCGCGINNVCNTQSGPTT